ncbi:hypothetical protein BDN72DRAFT_849110 [Pluteus cervinus]|uniref:Uncharacterized protein n=1 Tax=Pluteus cervinus TaxID=181527 RepID=A0ACD3A8S0_9AGAR|nr:hypothetical protein BDN72DRAFT_849110 [Pluteus cervinus]
MAGKFREQLGFGGPSHDAKWLALREYVCKMVARSVDLTVSLSLQAHQKQIASIADQICATCPTLFSPVHISIVLSRTRRAMLEQFIVSKANEMRYRRSLVQNPNPLPHTRFAPYPQPTMPQNHHSVGPIRVQSYLPLQAGHPFVRLTSPTPDPRRIVTQEIVKVETPVQAPINFESPLSHTLTYPTPRPLTTDGDEPVHPSSPSSSVAHSNPTSGSSEEDEESASGRSVSPLMLSPIDASEEVPEEVLEEASGQPGQRTPTPEPRRNVTPMISPSPRARVRQDSVSSVSSEEYEPQWIRVKSESVAQNEVHNFLASRNPPLSQLYPYLIAYGCTDMIHIKAMSRWPDDEIRVVVGKMMTVECEDASPTKPMDWDMFRHFLRETNASW